MTQLAESELCLQPCRGNSIFGIGIDTVALTRIEGLWRRHGERLADTILLAEELKSMQTSDQPVTFLAGRIAGKEAIVKALGTGFSEGIWFNDVGIPDARPGQSGIVLSRRASRMCRQLGVAGGQISITRSKERVFALAVLTK